MAFDSFVKSTTEHNPTTVSSYLHILDLTFAHFPPFFFISTTTNPFLISINPSSLSFSTFTNNSYHKHLVLLLYLSICYHYFASFITNMLQMSVLERQRAVLERLYNHSKQQLSSLPQQELAHLFTGCVQGNFNNFNMFGGRESNFVNCQEMARPSFSTVSNSSITTVSPPPEKENDFSTMIAPRENVVSTKKRKAEFSEEEDCEKCPGNDSKENSKTSEVQKPDYIHVRARRGQATDSHSLAERARREKISKKMKYLQDLVPGCNKVTGKAGMLDEIINYVQSLQKQVEFLSMKLATLNPRLDLNTDNIYAKDFPSYMTTTFPPTVAIPTLSEYNIIQHQQAGSTSDVAQMLPQRRDLMSFPDTYLGSSPLTVVQQQQPTFEPDLQSLFSVGFN